METSEFEEKITALTESVERVGQLANQITARINQLTDQNLELEVLDITYGSFSETVDLLVSKVSSIETSLRQSLERLNTI